MWNTQYDLYGTKCSTCELTSTACGCNVLSMVLTRCWISSTTFHYGDVVMGAIASQITSLTIFYSTVYSDAHQRNHQSSASLAFVSGEFPTQTASNAENVSICWCHHMLNGSLILKYGFKAFGDVPFWSDFNKIRSWYKSTFLSITFTLEIIRIVSIENGSTEYPIHIIWVW